MARDFAGKTVAVTGAAQLLGSGFAFLDVRLIPDYRGFLLAILPPGGFLALGLLLAGKRLIDARLAASQQSRALARAARAAA